MAADFHLLLKAADIHLLLQELHMAADFRLLVQMHLKTGHSPPPRVLKRKVSADLQLLVQMHLQAGQTPQQRVQMHVQAGQTPQPLGLGRFPGTSDHGLDRSEPACLAHPTSRRPSLALVK